MELVVMTSDKITTKKLLVAYNPARPSRGGGDFLIPIRDNVGVLFFGLKSKTTGDQGRMVYLGKEISVNDIFVRLVDTGRKIDSVSDTLKLLEAFIQMLQQYRIGSVIALEQSPDNAYGFRLRKVADMPAVEKRRLP